MSKKKVSKQVAGVQLLRRSGAAGPHGGRKPRSEVERRALKDQEG